MTIKDRQDAAEAYVAEYKQLKELDLARVDAIKRFEAQQDAVGRAAEKLRSAACVGASVETRVFIVDESTKTVTVRYVWRADAAERLVITVNKLEPRE